tara:strand:+ start:1054 stop:1683 length:630 start_codon:yes stop_codon:yes gene_type:complete
MLDQNIVEIKRTYNDTFSVDWDLSNRCNYSCSYCSDFLHQPKAPLLTLKNFKITIINLVKEVREKTNKEKIRIGLTGGEPLLHLDLINMVKFAVNHIDQIDVQTNGSASNKRYIEISEYIDKLGFSTQWEHIKWEKFLNKLIDIKQDVQCYMFVNLMVYPGKLKECDIMIDAFEKFNINYNVRRIRPLSHQNPNNYNEEEIRWMNQYVK